MQITGVSLRTGGPHLGLAIYYPSPGVIERIGADWDWVWIDGQHGQLGYQDALALVRACDLVQRPALVRVASHDWGCIGQVLDMGAAGVIVPLVNTVEEARALVRAAKFPPVGQRSYGGRRTVDRGGRLYSQTANEETLLVVQIETPEALKNAVAIAAVPGVDVLFFGADDVMMRQGGRMDEPRKREDFEADVAMVAKACREHDKLSIMVCHTPELLALSLFHAYDLIVVGADVRFLANSSKNASAEAREAIKQSLDSFKGSLVSLAPRKS